MPELSTSLLALTLNVYVPPQQPRSAATNFLQRSSPTALPWIYLFLINIPELEGTLRKFLPELKRSKIMLINKKKYLI